MYIYTSVISSTDSVSLNLSKNDSKPEHLDAELSDALPKHVAPDSPPVSGQSTSFNHPPIVPASQETCHLSPQSTFVQPSNMELQRIADGLPHDKLKPLGRALGLRETDLNTIEEKYFHNLYGMLLLWRSQAEEPSLEKLAEALHSMRCPHHKKAAERQQTMADESDFGMFVLGRCGCRCGCAWV